MRNDTPLTPATNWKDIYNLIVMFRTFYTYTTLSRRLALLLVASIELVPALRPYIQSLLRKQQVFVLNRAELHQVLTGQDPESFDFTLSLLMDVKMQQEQIYWKRIVEQLVNLANSRAKAVLNRLLEHLQSSKSAKHAALYSTVISMVSVSIFYVIDTLNLRLSQQQVSRHKALLYFPLLPH